MVIYLLSFFCFVYKSVNRSKDNEVIFSAEILISKQKRS